MTPPDTAGNWWDQFPDAPAGGNQPQAAQNQPLAASAAPSAANSNGQNAQGPQDLGYQGDIPHVTVRPNAKSTSIADIAGGSGKPSATSLPSGWWDQFPDAPPPQTNAFSTAKPTPDQPPVSTWQDIKNNAPYTGARGVAGLAGMGLNTFDLGRRGMNYMTGQDVPSPLPPELQSTNAMLKWGAGKLGIPYQEPQTTGGQIFDTTGQFLTGGLAAGAEKAAMTGADMLPAMAKTIPASLGAATGAQAVGAVAQGSPYQEPLELAAGAIGGMAGEGTGATIGGALKPMTKAGAAETAVQNYMRASDDPQALAAGVQNEQAQLNPEGPSSQVAPMAERSISEIAPDDLGVANKQQQSIQQLKDVDGSHIQERLVAAQQARQNAQDQFAQTLQTGNADDIGSMFTAHADALGKERDAIESMGQALVNKLPQTQEPEGLGRQAHAMYSQARNTAVQDENAAWGQLDPLRGEPTDFRPVLKGVNDAEAQINPRAGGQISPYEQKMFDTVKAWGRQPSGQATRSIDFGTLVDYSKNLNQNIRDAGMEYGFKSPQVQRLMGVKSSLKDTMAGKISEVANGNPEFQQRLVKAYSDWNTKQQQLAASTGRNNGGGSLQGRTAGEASALSGTGGAEGAAGKGLSANVGNKGVPPESAAENKLDSFGGEGPNKDKSEPSVGIREKGLQNKVAKAEAGFAESAPEKWKAANASTESRAKTFDTQDLNKAFKPGKGGELPKYGSMMDEFVYPGEGSAESIRQAKGAGVSEDVLTEHLINKMNSSGAVDRTNGTINDSSLAKFRRNYGDALTELPKAKDAISTVEKAQEAIDNSRADNKAKQMEFNQSAASKFVGDVEPEKVVGKIITGSDALNKTTELMQRVKGDKAAQDGLARATVDHILSKHADDAGGTKMMKYLENNREVVKRLTGGQQYNSLVRVAADRKSNAESGVGKTKANPTGDRVTLLSMIKKKAGGHAGEGLAGAGAGLIAEHGWGLIKHHPLAVAAGGAAYLARAFKQVGIKRIQDLDAEIALHPSEYADMFQKVATDGPPPMLSRRIAASILKTLPPAVATSEQKAAKTRGAP